MDCTKEVEEDAGDKFDDAAEDILGLDDSVLLVSFLLAVAQVATCVCLGGGVARILAREGGPGVTKWVSGFLKAKFDYATKIIVEFDWL